MATSIPRVSTQLGVCLGIRRASKDLLDEVIQDFRVRLRLNYRKLINFPELQVPPIIYRGIKPDLRNSIVEELSRLAAQHDKFEIELFPRYILPTHTCTGLYIGLEYRHITLEKIKLSLNRWDGGSASLQQTPQPIDGRKCSYMFLPIQRIETNDEQDAQSALRELILALGLARYNTLTAESLMLSQYEADSSGNPHRHTTDELFPFRDHNLQERLALLRSMAWDETYLELAAKHKFRSGRDVRFRNEQPKTTSDSLADAYPQIRIRRVGVTVKYKITERLRETLTETVFHPGLLRRVKSRRQVFDQVSYREVYPNLTPTKKRDHEFIAPISHKNDEAHPNHIFAKIKSDMQSDLESDFESGWDSNLDRHPDWDTHSGSNLVQTARNNNPTIPGASRLGGRALRADIRAPEKSSSTKAELISPTSHPKPEPEGKAVQTSIDQITEPTKYLGDPSKKLDGIRLSRRAHARMLQMAKIDRPLIRPVKSGPLITYKYHVYDPPKLGNLKGRS